MNIDQAKRQLAALEIALARLEKRIDGNTDPSREKFLKKRYSQLFSEVRYLQEELAKRVK